MDDDINNNEFKNYPVSMVEIKSSKSENCKDWSPRDCLIALLREIDNGSNVSTVVISYEQIVDGKRLSRFLQSSGDGLKSLGLMVATQHLMQQE